MRMMMIAVLALLVLGGGGAGAYFYFQKPAEASVGGEIEANHEANKEAKAKKHGEEKVEFVELDPLILPIVNSEGVSQTVSLVIVLEVGNPAAKLQVETLTPRLKDAYIQDMYGMLNEHAALKGGVIQISTLKERPNKITVDVMGDDVVNDVLLQVVQQRPI